MEDRCSSGIVNSQNNDDFVQGVVENASQRPCFRELFELKGKFTALQNKHRKAKDLIEFYTDQDRALQREVFALKQEVRLKNSERELLFQSYLEETKRNAALQAMTDELLNELRAKNARNRPEEESVPLAEQWAAATETPAKKRRGRPSKTK